MYYQLYQKLDRQNINDIVKDGVTIIGNVHIGEGSIVRGKTTFYDPTFIGDNVTINAYTEIQSGTAQC